MAFTPKILGQQNPSAANLEDMYEVPALTTVTISSILVANRSSVTTSFRFSVAVAGAADDLKQYLYYDIDIPGNDSFGATLGITLGPADKVRVFATLATLSFNLFGIEEA